MPAGEFCYCVHKVEPGEVLVNDFSRFGKEVRHGRFGAHAKRVLCPFWRRTEHGTTRCELTGAEEWHNGEVFDAALDLFGADALYERFRPPSWLDDEIKTCGVNEFVDDGEHAAPEPDLPGPGAAAFPLGSMVRHRKFGVGRVIGIGGDGPHATLDGVWLRVEFEQPYGVKVVSVALARLEVPGGGNEK
ncbi:MAG: hypothetical protein U1E89_05865 [Burkholderiaceae bacterium]